MLPFNTAKKISSGVIVLSLVLFSFFSFTAIHQMRQSLATVAEQYVPIFDRLLKIRKLSGDLKRLFDIYTRQPRVHDVDILTPITQMLIVGEKMMDTHMSETQRQTHPFFVSVNDAYDVTKEFTAKQGEGHDSAALTASRNGVLAQQQHVGKELRGILSQEMQLDEGGKRALLTLYQEMKTVFLRYCKQEIVGEDELHVLLKLLYQECQSLRILTAAQDVVRIDHVLDSAKKFEIALDEYIDNERRDPASATTSEMKAAAVSYAESVYSLVQEMIEALNDTTVKLQEKTIADVTTLEYLLVFEMCAMSVGVMCIFFWIGRMISRRVELLRRGAEKFSLGDLQHRISINVDDQFGDLAHAFNEMIDALQKTTVSREYMNNIMGAMNDVLIVLSPDGIITDVNAATHSLLGFAKEEMVGKPLRSFIKEGPLVDEDTSRVRLTDVKKPEEVLCLSKSGQSVWFLCSCSAVGSDAESVVFVGKDITERKKTELEKERYQQEIQHAQKMESIGTLAAGIAHEINTPIQFIGDNVYFLLQSMERCVEMVERYKQQLCSIDKEAYGTMIEAMEEEFDYIFLRDEVPAALGQIKEGVSRVTKIVGAMKNYAHTGDYNATPSDINDAIETTVTISRNEWKYNAEVETNLEDIPKVTCCIGDIKQVVLNLIVNAAHAIKDVKTSTKKRGHITIGTRVKENKTVEISIADTGAGIPEEIRDRVFDQFFTTKAVGKGTGQGLALAYFIIVEKHKGVLRFDSEVGKGTTFYIELPIEG